jgi:hypothetical protein
MLPMIPTGLSANMPSMTMAIWLTLEYATRRFQSCCAIAHRAPYTIPIIESVTIIGTNCRVASGRIGSENRMNP